MPWCNNMGDGEKKLFIVRRVIIDLPAKIPSWNTTSSTPGHFLVYVGIQERSLCAPNIKGKDGQRSKANCCSLVPCPISPPFKDREKELKRLGPHRFWKILKVFVLRFGTTKSKTMKSPLPLILLLIITSCQKQSDSSGSTNYSEIDTEKDSAAIMSVIDGESAAFWNKDYDKWASYWVQEPYIRTMGWWKGGGVTVVEGWDERAERSKENFQASPEANPTATKVRRENVNLRIYKDVAWLTFDQYGQDTGDTLMDMPGRSRETRILEKKNDSWRIAYAGWLLEGE